MPLKVIFGAALEALHQLLATLIVKSSYIKLQMMMFKVLLFGLLQMELQIQK